MDKSHDKSALARLKSFVEAFCEEFIEKLDEYSQEAKGKKHKSGKTVDLAIESVRPVLGELIGGVSKPIIQALGNDLHRKRAKMIFSILGKETEYLKDIITNVGFNIFKSFEYQYMEIDDVGGSEIAMRILAQDAVNRIMDGIYKYVEKENEKSNSSAMDNCPLQNLIIKQFIQGKPKGIIGTYLPIQLVYFKNIKCRISNIYKNVGLISLTSDFKIDRCFRRSDKSYDDLCKYGSRLIFDFEMCDEEFLAVLKDEYTEEFVDTKYVYTIREADLILMKDELKPEEDETTMKLNKIKECIECLQKEQEKGMRLLEEIKDKAIDSTSKPECKQFWFDMNTKQSSLFFTGRETFLEQIDKESLRGFVIISGLSGVGKTEIAIKYARSRYTQQDVVIWINAESFNTMETSFLSLYKKLGFKLMNEEEKSIKIIIEDIFAYFEKGRVLLIYDNAERFNDIKEFLPIGLPPNSNTPNVLITSTNADWRTQLVHLTVLTLGDFEDHEAYSFITHYLSIEDYDGDEVQNMTKKLNNFPLALQHVAEIILNEFETLKNIKQDLTIANYLKKFDRKIETLLQSQTIDFDNVNSKTIYTTMRLVVDKIEKKSRDVGPLAIRILKMMAYFSPNKISSETFLPVAEHNELTLATALKLLKDKSVINISESINIHGLMQQVVRLHVQDIKQEEVVLEESLQLIKDHLANVNYLQHCISIWNYACKYDHLITTFLNKNNILRKTRTNFLHIIVEGCKFEAICDIIKNIENKCDPSDFTLIINAKDRYRGTLLHRAATRGDLRIVNLLLTKGALKDAAKIHKLTPLHLAVSNGRLEVTKALLTSQNIGSKTKFMFTSLHLAARSGFPEIVELLLERGADVNATTKFNYTPLHLAIQRDYKQVVKILLEHEEINVNSVTGYQETPLHFASRQGNLEMVSNLLKKGSEVDAKTRENITPLHYATMNNHKSVVSILVQHKADLSVTTTQGNTPLHISAKSGNWDIVKELLNNLSNSDVRNNDNKKAADIAMENGHLELGHYINTFKN